MNVYDLYDNFTEKYGFHDGEDTPVGIEKVRKMLIDAINLWLGPESDVEAYEYDRPGMHNWCMILYRSKSDPNKDDIRLCCDKINGLFELIQDENLIDYYTRTVVYRNPKWKSIIREKKDEYLSPVKYE